MSKASVDFLKVKEDIMEDEEFKAEYDKYILDIVEERMENFDDSKLISSEDIISKYNLDRDRINEISTLIEIE